MLDDVRARIGHSVAPPRFLLFVAILILILVPAPALATIEDHRIALLIGFDVAVLAFLLSVFPLLNDDAATMRRTAQINDANRVALLALTVLISMIVFFAVGTLIAAKQVLQWQGIALIVATLALAGVFANTVFALHYAHLYYHQAEGKDRGGLDVPHADHPDYWDFFYFSFTLGMTFQTSGVAITGSHMRKVVLGQSLAAFLFNMGILAFTVNALGGL